MEIKLSTNPKVVDGYTKQLKIYEEAEETNFGFYIVIDVGKMGNKAKRLLERKNSQSKLGKRTSTVVFVDGQRRKSASKA